MSDHLIAEANRHARALIIERSAPNAPRPPDSLRPQMSTPTPMPRTCGEISCDECNDRYAALAAECDQLRAEAERLRAGIGECLRQNGHLADGDNCTLIGLKRCLRHPTAARESNGGAA